MPVELIASQTCMIILYMAEIIRQPENYADRQSDTHLVSDLLVSGKAFSSTSHRQSSDEFASGSGCTCCCCAPSASPSLWGPETLEEPEFSSSSDAPSSLLEQPADEEDEDESERLPELEDDATSP